MSGTVNTTSDMICQTCQISNGFSAADRRSYITLVSFVCIALISCYIGVLWFAIRTRFIPDKTPKVTTMHTNEAFNNNNEDDDYDDYIQPIDNSRRGRSPSRQPIHFDEESQKMRP